MKPFNTFVVQEQLGDNWQDWSLDPIFVPAVAFRRAKSRRKRYPERSFRVVARVTTDTVLEEPIEEAA